MISGTKYNLKSPGVKRLMREAAELREPTDEYSAKPLDDNLFEWHFTVRGPSGTEFEGGLYHGRILLPTQYPMQPPNIILLTPNGRFEINKKICLSISGYHPESWQPSWSIRTALLALIAFMPSPGRGTIGSLDYTPEERQILAKKSQTWECELCGKLCDHLAKEAEGGHRLGSAKPLTQEESELIQQIALKAEEEKFEKKDISTSNNDNTENDESSAVRQRINPITSVDSVQRIEIISTSSPTLKDKTITYFMILLIVAILLLILRRLFLL